MPQQALLQDFQESDLHRHVFMLIYKMYNRSYTRIANTEKLQLDEGLDIL
jgi:hypothetical protein